MPAGHVAIFAVRTPLRATTSVQPAPSWSSRMRRAPFEAAAAEKAAAVVPTWSSTRSPAPEMAVVVPTAKRAAVPTVVVPVSVVTPVTPSVEESVAAAPTVSVLSVEMAPAAVVVALPPTQNAPATDIAPVLDAVTSEVLPTAVSTPAVENVEVAVPPKYDILVAENNVVEAVPVTVRSPPVVIDVLMVVAAWTMPTTNRSTTVATMAGERGLRKARTFVTNELIMAL